MKKILALCFLLLSIDAKAYVLCSDAVYCPTSNKLIACYPTGSYLDWWSVKSANGKVNIGTYAFAGAYNVKSGVGYFSACIYKLRTGDADTFITLTNTQGDLLAYNNGKNGWTQDGTQSNCESSFLNLCPFVSVSDQK